MAIKTLRIDKKVNKVSTEVTIKISEGGVYDLPGIGVLAVQDEKIYLLSHYSSTKLKEDKVGLSVNSKPVIAGSTVLSAGDKVTISKPATETSFIIG